MAINQLNTAALNWTDQNCMPGSSEKQKHMDEFLSDSKLASDVTHTDKARKKRTF